MRAQCESCASEEFGRSKTRKVASSHLGANNEAVATYLGVDIRELHKPLTLPCIVLALDFETSDWDEQCTFARQDAHFNAGFPCRADHKSDAGHICAIGYSVFRQDSNSPRTYYVEEQISVVIQLPDGQCISKPVIDAHGITDQICARGQQLTTVLHAVIGWLKQGAEICCHNLAHETLIACREIQKRSLIGHSVLPEEDASLFFTVTLHGALHSAVRETQEWFSSCTG